MQNRDGIVQGTKTNGQRETRPFQDFAASETTDGILVRPPPSNDAGELRLVRQARDDGGAADAKAVPLGLITKVDPAFVKHADMSSQKPKPVQDFARPDSMPQHPPTATRVHLPRKVELFAHPA